MEIYSWFLTDFGVEEGNTNHRYTAPLLTSTIKVLSFTG